MLNKSVKLIAHRGNIFGRDEKLENSPKYLDSAIQQNFDVEVDIRVINKEIFLGHDIPLFKINLDWLNRRKNFLWVHCKNFEAINFLSNRENELNFFFHESDYLTLTSKRFLWTFPGKLTSKKSIAVMPELVSVDWLDNIQKSKLHPYGYCSDYVGEILLKL